MTCASLNPTSEATAGVRSSCTAPVVAAKGETLRVDRQHCRRCAERVSALLGGQALPSDPVEGRGKPRQPCQLRIAVS